MEGRARGAPFCKKIFFFLFSGSGSRTKDRRKKKKVETLLQSKLCTHCNQTFMLMKKRAIFTTYDSMCLCAFHECYVCVHLYVVDVC
jgi:hypothetical protein